MDDNVKIGEDSGREREHPQNTHAQGLYTTKWYEQGSNRRRQTLKVSAVPLPPWSHQNMERNGNSFKDQASPSH